VLPPIGLGLAGLVELLVERLVAGDAARIVVGGGRTARLVVARLRMRRVVRVAAHRARMVGLAWRAVAQRFACAAVIG
jgi:uncharacterized protein YgbK (DUF1537 family)